MFVNTAMPWEFVMAFSVLFVELMPGTGGVVPEVGPLCCTIDTVSPATGLLPRR